MHEQNINELLKQFIREESLPLELKRAMWRHIDGQLVSMRAPVFGRPFHQARTVLAWIASTAIIVGLGSAGGVFVLNRHAVWYTHSRDVVANQAGLNDRTEWDSGASGTTQNQHEGWGVAVPTDLKIGSLGLGDPLAETLKTYGEPQLRTTAHGVGTPEWVFSGGTIVDGDPIWQITVNAEWVGSTPRGIHVGSSLAALKNAYSDLHVQSTPGGGSYLSQSYDGNLFTLGFSVQNGVVTQIDLIKNLPPF